MVFAFLGDDLLNPIRGNPIGEGTIPLVTMRLRLPISKFPDMPCKKKTCSVKRCRSMNQQPGTKSGRRPGDKPFVNRLSTARSSTSHLFL